MKRRVNKRVLAQRAPVSWKRAKNSLLKKVSEQHIGTLLSGDGVTGAPVIELEYKRRKLGAVLEEADMATYERIWGGTASI